jgi:4-amino-4-deoxy-L-arabinose transferase-like glycosyltransferase
MLLVAGFLVLCGWWLASDGRVPDFDTAKHVGWALDIRDAFVRGDPGYWFNSFTAYPPLVHTVGGIGQLVGGVGIPSAVLAADLVFVPLLGLSLYQLGWRLGGGVTGTLAVIFALGAPLMVAQAHVFVLELPETALVAAALWGLIASEGFSRQGPSLCAGIACGLGMLTKPTFPFFVAGALAVVLFRGGRRERRGLVMFIGGALVVGAPWYLRHVGRLGQTISYATAPPRPPRFSLSNASWFAWDQINGQLFLPFFLLTVIGALDSVSRWRGGWGQGDYTPELVIGGAVAYLGLTYGMSLHAPYYSLPALAYEALLATVWVPRVSRKLRVGAAIAICLAAGLNIIAVGVHSLGRVSIRAPGQVPQGFIQPRRFTLLRSYSWPVGPPQGDGRLLDVFRALRARGFRQLEVQAASNQIDFDVTGVVLMARIAGLRRPPGYAPEQLGSDAVFVLRATAPTPWPACRHLSDGSAVLVLARHRGSPRGWVSACPSRA